MKNVLTTIAGISLVILSGTAAATVARAPSGGEPGVIGIVSVARTSPGGEFIACKNSVYSNSQKDSVRCEARDNRGDYYSCETTRSDPNISETRFNMLQTTASGANESSTIWFTWNGAGQCSRLNVYNTSDHL